jgi:DNA-binding LytR/AlgR family response regulator
MKLKCVIVDDEPLASEGLAKYTEIIDFLELVAVAQNTLELSKVLEREQVDLIFLDIQLPYMTGLDFLKISSGLPMVIFTTAYSNYALEGFQFDVLDYLLKPITFNHFFKACNKAKDYHYLKNLKHTHPPAEPESLFIRCENKYEKILIPDILFVEAMQNYVVIHTVKGRHMTLLPLKTVENYLDANSFLRVHRSYLVAVSKIDSIENNELIIQKRQIPISRSLREEVLAMVLKNKLMGK